MQEIPIIMYGREYWDRVIDFQFLADEGRHLPTSTCELISYADTPQEAWDTYRRFSRSRTMSNPLRNNPMQTSRGAGDRRRPPRGTRHRARALAARGYRVAVHANCFAGSGRGDGRTN